MSYFKSKVISRRLKSGGLTSFNRSIKRKRDRPGHTLKVRVSTKHRTKRIRTRGGHLKQKFLEVRYTNLYDPIKKTFSKTEILSIQGNSADRNYIQRNIITKGALILTTQGKAVVTSRPGQSGTLNSLLVSEQD